MKAFMPKPGTLIDEMPGFKILAGAVINQTLKDYTRAIKKEQWDDVDEMHDWATNPTNPYTAYLDIDPEFMYSHLAKIRLEIEVKP